MKPTWKCLAGALMMIVCCARFTSAQAKKGASAAAGGASQPAAAPAPSSTAPVESQLLAYGGLNHIASAIATTVCGQITAKTKVIIYDQPSFATLQAYQAFVANANVLVAAYKTLIPNKAALKQDLTTLFHDRHLEYDAKAKTGQLVPRERDLAQHMAAKWKHDELFANMAFTLAPTEPVGAFTSLLSTFAASSTTESAGSITIPDSAMAVALTRAINVACQGKNLSIIYPPLFGHGSSSDFSSADIQAQIQKIDDIRTEAHDVVKAGLPADGGKPAPSRQSVLVAALADIDGLYDNFMNSLLNVSSSTGVAGSASVIQGYQLATLLAGQEGKPAITIGPETTDAIAAIPPAYVLLASVVAAGGTERVHKSLWTALWKGDKITYSGGAVVNVSLWTGVSDSPLYADVLRYRTPFMRIESPHDVGNVNAGDNLPKK